MVTFIVSSTVMVAMGIHVAILSACNCGMLLLPQATAFAPPLLVHSPRVHKTRLSSTCDENDAESSSFDMKELQKRMEQQMTQYYDLFMSDDDNGEQPESVYIIVFNPDIPEEQGVHTIEFPKGSGNNVILAFESVDECVEFAEMLKNMQFYNPLPQMANLSELQVFCQGMGVPVKVVPRGKGLRPPADNVEELSMNPNLGVDKQRLNEAFLASNEENEKDHTSKGSDSVWE